MWFGQTKQINHNSRLKEQSIYNLIQDNQELRNQITLLSQDKTYMQNYIRHKLNMIGTEETFHYLTE